jgi:hypothetical protein
MTTIRKIVTSKVDGNSADSTSTNEIRPFGEIAVYLNTEPNPDKLTLMMFDGTRTHLKSMVLAPGRLYGSDADSGDGRNRDTIKLIPDASLSDYTGNDQYLIVDPTDGNIHIRAGGTIDNSDADLYLGGKQTFVRVSDDSDNVAIRTGLNASIENVAVDVVDEWGPPGGPGGVWRMFFLDADYPALGTTVQVGDTVTTSWGTPITAAITDIVQDIGEGTWALHFDQDITAEFNFGDTVTFTRGLEVLLITTRLSKTWTFDSNGSLQIPGGIAGNNDINITVVNEDSSTYTWNFGQTGDLTAPGDITTGLDGLGGRFIQDCADGTTSMRWINMNQGSNSAQLIRAYTGNPKLNTEVERAQIKLNWDQTENKSGLTIRTFNQTDPNNEVDHDWLFKGDGVLQLPVDGDIVDSDGNSVLSVDNNNIWVQTFVSNAPTTDFPQIATSIEYDDNGNVIALFSHSLPDLGDNGGRYYSVGKYTDTGTKIWTARFVDALNTDGWGLAVDNADDWVYVAGQTSGAPDYAYDVSTLTKIDSGNGSVEWSKIYDFGVNSSSAVVDVDSDGNPVMIGYANTLNNDGYLTITKVDKTNGNVTWTRKLDGQSNEEAYGMAVGPDGEIVAVGYMDEYYEPASHSVTPLVGSDVNVLVINRSDLNGDTLTDTWEVSGVDAEGTIGVDAINAYTGLTGTVQEGTGAVFEIADSGLGYYDIAGMLNGGTNYLPGHKILVLGTDLGGATPDNDCIITVDSIDPGGAIFQWSVSGLPAGAEPTVYSPVTGTNYQTGSGLTFDLELDSGNTYTEHPYEIISMGTNYVTGDVVTVSGALLGGTTPANDLTITVSTDAGGVTTFNSFTGTQQTTTYRVRTEDVGLDFSGAGTWTLSGTVVDTDDRMVVVKYTSDGTIAWQSAIQFDADYDCYGADADIDSNGNIYICGQFAIDGGGNGMALVKFDSSGAKQWSRRVTGDCATTATSIVVGPDDKLYISGVNGDPIAQTFSWIVAKFSLDGTVEWQRSIENTDGVTFAGNLFGPEGGGSNLAVRQGYVALAGGFGNVEGNEQSYAAILQIPSSGNVFAAGPWSVTAANLSGTFDATASDITVVNAGLTDSDNALNVSPDSVNLETEVGNFLVGTVYTAPGGDNSLVNGVYSVVLGNTGVVTLPSGGTITEVFVTSNPTIQLTPASPTVASQKLVIKGGGGFNYTYTDNGININYSTNTAIVGATLTFYIYSPTYANQTLYWWIYPEGANISDPGSGTVTLTDYSGTISFELDSDDNEFTIRVSPEDHNYGPGVIGVQSGLINGDAPTFDVDHHLHLTTGDLTETSIFLGTDDHNVRTTTDGGIEITTPNVSNNVWQFGTDGSLTLPIGVSIDSSVSPLYPKIIADSGKLFSIQGQGSTGSAALAWSLNPNTDTQYAAVGVNQGGGDNLAKVVLTAGASTPTLKVWKFDETGALTIPGDIRSEGAINIDINLSDSTLRRWRFGEDGDLTFPDGTNQSTALVQGEQIFTLDTGAIDYAPTAVDFNLLFVTPAIGYSSADPTSVTLPNGVPGQRLVIFNGSSLATLTVNPGLFGRDISAGVVAEFIYSGFDGLWIPLYGTNSLT